MPIHMPTATELVEEEYGFGLIPELQSDYYDAIIVAVNHDEVR